MHYSRFKKIYFYLMLAYHKLISPFECQNYRLRVLINEFSFLFYVLGFRKLKSEYKTKIVLKTKFGDFHVRNIGIDLLVASPSYERLDLEELIKRINYALTQNHNIIFIDVGAGFGKFTIAIGSHFRKYANKLSIFSFEPEPESYKLLKENIIMNRLRNIKAYNFALSDKTTLQKFFYFKPMKQIVSFKTSNIINVHTKTLDNFYGYVLKPNNVEIFIKLDVEGHEIEVLKGSKKTISMAKNTTLLVEDSAVATSQKLIQYLSNHGTFLIKNTNHNSFWRLAS